jgi:hypothetical protein
VTGESYLERPVIRRVGYPIDQAFAPQGRDLTADRRGVEMQRPRQIGAAGRSGAPQVRKQHVTTPFQVPPGPLPQRNRSFGKPDEDR